MVQWIECWPANQKVTSLTPSQDTCLGCGPDLWLGVWKRQLVYVSLTHQCSSPSLSPSLPLSLKINKQNLQKKKRDCLNRMERETDLPICKSLIYTEHIQNSHCKLRGKRHHAINGTQTIGYPCELTKIGFLPHILNTSIAGELKV